MIDTAQTLQFIEALTGSPDTVINWRCIHDVQKNIPAHNFTGTLTDTLPTLQAYSENGYGIFCAINDVEGRMKDGRLTYELDTVRAIRTHCVDLDNTLTSHANLERAVAAGASFYVSTSPDKFHVYWRVQPYQSNEFFTLIQKKLIQLFDGDKQIVDATRVMRVPGFLHQKGQPTPVTFAPLTGATYTADAMQQFTAHVNIVEHFGSRSPLGTEEMQAPSLEWLTFALSLVDPNDMERGEWLSFSAAFKQAGFNYADDETMFQLWSTWCNQYSENDAGENRKLWNSIKDTEVGWKSIERRSTVKAYMSFGHKQPPAPNNNPQGAKLQDAYVASPATTEEPERFGEILSGGECAEYFEDCYFVNREGKIYSKAGRFMNANQFNGRYGGKHFIITSTGKVTDEPWKAALRSSLHTVAKVDHVRFLPDRPTFEIVNDALGRPGLNTYIAANVKSTPGDVSLWLDHVNRILPDPNDQHLLFQFMAHTVKYPGHKIAWSPLLQSAEGIGKTVFFEVMQHALGDMYVYSPKAPELIKSGSTFNAWMRGKLLIVVNEIKIDERRELIEILKPMITDNRVEIQSKGVDQEMEDNPANWFFFSNFKDAIPINQNGRRYAVFYSSLQSQADIVAAGMDKVYFDRLWQWLRDDGGYENITHWLMNYPIEKGDIPMRAPETSSYAEALRISRSPLEVIIDDCLEDNRAGFMGGYISSTAVLKMAKTGGIRNPNTRTVQACLEGMGYVKLGRGARSYMQEDINSRSDIYGNLSSLPLEGFGKAQGYE